MNIYVTRGGHKFGPYTPEQVSAYLASGHLLPEDLAWREGVAVWMPLAQLEKAGELKSNEAKVSLFSSFEEMQFPRGRKRRWLFASGIIALLSVFAIVIVTVSTNADYERAVAKARAHRTVPVGQDTPRESYYNTSALGASVRQSPFGVTVTNDGGSTYKDVTVKINYGWTGEYSSSCRDINPGESITIPYSAFTNDDNERFNYSRVRPERVMVRATVDGRTDWEEFSVAQ
jgi:hypothetical protein